MTMDGDKHRGRQMQMSITPAQQALASCSGSLLTSLLVTPFDVVKVRLQVQEKSKANVNTRAAPHAKKPCKLTPFDVVKVRLQMQKRSKIQQPKCFIYCNGLMDHVCKVHGVMCPNHPMSTAACADAACTNGAATASAAIREWYARPGHFNGTADAFVKIARNEGVASLWSGLPPTLVMAIPATVVYFTAYDQLKYRMGYREDDPSTKHIPLLAGSSARIFASVIVTPLELFRTKKQSEKLSYRQLGQAVRVSVKQGGPLSVYRGLSATLLRDVPFSAVYWTCYEALKAMQLQHQNLTPSFSQTFISGAGAGTIAAIITQPFDVVKTQRQIELGEAIMFEKGRVTSTFRLAYQLYQQGLSSFYAGLLPRLIRIGPACAIMISSYEYGKSFFYQYNIEQEAARIAREQDSS